MGLYGNKLISVLEQVIYSDSDITITMDGNGITDSGFSNIPYIKVYNGSTVTKSTKMARINLKDMVYEKHNNGRVNKEPWKLNNKDKKKLNEILDKPSRKINNTSWEYIQICNKIFADQFNNKTIDIDKLF